MPFVRLFGFILALLLPLCWGGKLYAMPASAPESWSQSTVSPSLQLPQSSSPKAVVSVQESSIPPTVLLLPAQNQSKTPNGAALLTLSPDQDALTTELSPTEDELDDDLSLLDPEALEEAKILTEEDVTPPEDEGATTAVPGIQFDFPVVANQKVQYYIDYFTGPGRAVFSRWLERSTRYLPYMQEVFTALGLPRDLTYLAIVESGLNPKAYSRSHASGPWQFIPNTGKIFGLEADYWWDERRDFEKSTLAAALYLKELYTLFNGDWYLAVASYNAGPGAVSRAMARSGLSDYWSLSHSGFLPEETRNYIPKLLAVLMIAKEPEMYGFSEMQFLDPLSCDKVAIDGPVDLTVVARLTGKSYEEIKALNPELKRWCTPPKMESYLLNIPPGTQETFLTAFNDLPASKRRDYKLHKLAKGESLKDLARQHQLSIDEILRANSLSSSKGIKAGRSLIIPLRSGIEAIPREDLIDDPVAVKFAQAKTYKVKKGDTLSLIARRTGASLDQLTSWNRLSRKSRLKIGQTLVVGTGTKVSNSSHVTAKTSTKVKSKGANGKDSATNGSRIVYTVKKGDTVYKIARLYALNPSQILSWNNLDNDHTLQPGQNLTLRIQGRRGG